MIHAVRKMSERLAASGLIIIEAEASHTTKRYRY